LVNSQDIFTLKWWKIFRNYTDIDQAKVCQLYHVGFKFWGCKFRLFLDFHYIPHIFYEDQTSDSQ